MSIDAVTVYELTTFTQDNLGPVDWDENYFKWCHFEDFSIEGKVICSTFLSCSFKNIDWYWGLFSDCNFINCEFKDCVFRGTSFPGSRFVECTLTNCRFVKDNLNGDCDLEETHAYGCTIDGCEGFNAKIV